MEFISRIDIDINKYLVKLIKSIALDTPCAIKTKFCLEYILQADDSIPRKINFWAFRKMSRLKFVLFLSLFCFSFANKREFNFHGNNFQVYIQWIFISHLVYFVSNHFSCRAIVFYLTTTISAVVLGIILVTTIRPGVIGSNDSYTTNTTSSKDSKRVYTTDTLLDLIR